jgi:hypothetical protein
MPYRIQDGMPVIFRLSYLCHLQHLINVSLSPAPSAIPPRPSFPLQVRKVQALQQAVSTFDRIATLPRQGRVSEIELRLYLAGHGAGSADVAKVRRDDVTVIL